MTSRHHRRPCLRLGSQQVARDGMVLVADDPVSAERELDQLVERRQLAAVGIGSVSGLRVAGLISAPDPDELDPSVHRGPGGGASRHPSFVVAPAIFRQLERPQTRRAVAVDDGDERAGLASSNRPRICRPDDEVLLIDHAVDLVRVDLRAAAISRVGIDAEEVLGLADRDAVKVRVDEPIAERRIEPERESILAASPGGSAFFGFSGIGSSAIRLVVLS